MGIHKLPCVTDYWKTNEEMFQFPFFSAKMSSRRFRSIMRCLHFSDNNQPTNPPDRLKKVRPLLRHFLQRMDSVYSPGRELAIDESIVAWRGRLIFRQYIIGKRHKYGLKLYILAEPSGMVINVIIYGGKNDDLGGVGHTAKVVMKLMENRLDKGHSLYMDRYYNSISLSEQLLERGTYCTGTLKTNRKGNPASVVKAKLGKGDVVFQHCNGISVGKWHDTRDVPFITTEYSHQVITYKDKYGKTKTKPLAIKKYNTFMCGIDKQDQMLSYYSFERKTVRWDLKMGCHIFHMMILNAFLMYKQHCGNKEGSIDTFYDFHVSIIKELLKSLNTTTTKIPTFTPNTLHIPSKTTNEKGQKIRRKCKVCYKNGNRKDTAYFCDGCEEKPYLCLDSCFRKYHDREIQHVPLIVKSPESLMEK